MTRNASHARSAQQLFEAAFPPDRPRRSGAYRYGVMTCLAARTSATGQSLTPPFAQGSAEFDAFFAGVDEGHAVYEAEQQRVRADS